MKKIKNHIIWLDIVIVMFGVLVSCGNKMATFTYDNEAMFAENKKIKDVSISEQIR